MELGLKHQASCFSFSRTVGVGTLESIPFGNRRSKVKKYYLRVNKQKREILVSRSQS